MIRRILRLTLFAALASGALALLTVFMVLPEVIFGLLAVYIVVAGVYLIRQRNPRTVRDSKPVRQSEITARI